MQLRDVVQHLHRPDPAPRAAALQHHADPGEQVGPVADRVQPQHADRCRAAACGSPRRSPACSVACRAVGPEDRVMVSRSTVSESSSTATLSAYRITRPSTATAGAAADTRVSLGQTGRGCGRGPRGRRPRSVERGSASRFGRPPEEHQADPAQGERGSQATAALRATAAMAAVHGTPSAARATTRAPSRGLAPLGRAPRRRAGWPRRRRGPGQRRHRVAGGGDGAEQQGRDGQLVRRPRARGRGRAAGGGAAAGRQQLGAEPADHQEATTARSADAEGDDQHPPRAARFRRRPRRRQADGTDEPVHAHAHQGVPRPSPARVSRRIRHRSAPTWPGVSSPSSSDSAYARMCQTRSGRPREHPPAQRAERVLADRSQGAGRAGRATGSRGGAGAA